MAQEAAAQTVTLMAPTPCVSLQRLDELKRQFGEMSFGAGLSADGKNLYEILVSKQGTFTIVMRDTRGLACLIGAGNSWLTVRRPVEGEGL